MRRSWKLVGAVILGAGALVGNACGGDDGDEKKAGTGGTGGNEGGLVCGPSELGFPGECKAGAPETCCADTVPVMKKRINDPTCAGGTKVGSDCLL